MTARPPVPRRDVPPGLRQRRRADGSWRVWWEPSASARAKGFTPVELDATRARWSVTEARKLGQAVTRALAEGGRATGGLRTMSALIGDYLTSGTFRRLAPKTQADYRARMKIIDAKWGGDPVPSFTKPVMRAWYETLEAASGEWQAVAMLRIMSLLMSHAELKGWRAEDSNPCRRLQMTTPRPRHRSASWAEYDALIAAARDLGLAAMECAIGMATLMGQRQTDIRTARADGFRQIDQDGTPALVWFLERSKRDNLGQIPVHPEVEPLIRARLMQGAPHESGILLLDDLTDAPMSESLFHKRFDKVRRHAARHMPALRGLQFRDLRRTFGVFARAGGASVDDIGNVLGNSVAADPQLEETYLPATFATTTRAVDAIRRPATPGKKSAG